MLLLLTVFLAIAFIVVSSAVFKLHPLIALLLASLGVGLVAGLPIDHLAELIGKGFGELMAKIGLMVVLGCIIGAVLDRSGAALQVAEAVLRLFGTQRPATAMAIIGAIVGIPVFCDSGFIILAKLGKVVARRTQTSVAASCLSLGGGLFATHTLVPPTPGPIAAAGNLGVASSLGLVIVFGLLVSLPNVLLCQWFARRVGATIHTPDDEARPKAASTQLVLPSTAQSLAPILIPIVLITLASLKDFMPLPPALNTLLSFLGSSLIALLLAVFYSYRLFPAQPAQRMLECIRQGIEQSGPTLVLVGAGGAFGAVLKATPLADMVSHWMQQERVSGAAFLLLTFGIAAFFKTAQGSTTSAMVLTTSILAPLLSSAGFTSPVEIVLVVMAVGSGALTVSHSNDAYFWVVSQFSGLSANDAYRSHTLMTGLQGLVSLATTLLLYAVWLVL